MRAGISKSWLFSTLAGTGMVLGLYGCARAAENETVNPPDIIGPTRQLEEYGYLQDPGSRKGFWWEPYKYVPLSSKRDSPFLTMGGEARLRYEWIQNDNFGAGPQDNGGYLLSRILPYVSLTLPASEDGLKLKAFGQVESGFNEGDARGPAPVDEEDFGLLQGFLCLTVTFLDGELDLQGGRQVVSFGTGRLIDSRYGTNILLSFDGTMAHWANQVWDLQGFYLRPVLVDPDPLDDVSGTDQQFWGFYGTRRLPDIFPGSADVLVDLYYLGFYDANAVYNSGSGKELRHTIGTRFSGKEELGPGWLDWNDEAMFQFGSFDSGKGHGKICAWSVGTETGYTFRVETEPRIFLRANAISGDLNSKDADLQTFNPLFPKGKYFGELTPVGPYNLLNLQGGISFHPVKEVTLYVQGGPYWRASTEDAVYGVGGNIVRPATASANSAWIGGQVEWVAEWKPSREWSFLASYSQFVPGSFIDQTGPAKTTHFAALEALFQF